MFIKVTCAILALVTLGNKEPNQSVKLTRVTDSSLPKAFVQKIDFAFKHGMPDPVGGTFSEVTIIFGKDRFGKDVKRKTTGWIMPAQGNIPAYVLGWDGIGYNNYQRGSDLSLESFVRSEIKDYLSRRNAYSHNDPRSVITPIGLAFLYRLRQTSLIGEIVSKINAPYLYSVDRLSSDVLWYRLEDGFVKRSQGLHDAASEQFDWLMKNESAWNPQRFPFVRLEPAPEKTLDLLAKDSERRAKRKERAPFDSEVNQKLPTEQRIQQILDYLDDVASSQTTIPGSPEFHNDPIYLSALNLGEPMLEPLIQAVQTDQRILLKPNGTGMMRYCTLSSVQDVELNLIKEISAIYEFPRKSDGTYDFDHLIKQLHSTKGYSKANRLFEILLSNSANYEQWAEAAKLLTAPNGTSRYNYTYLAIRPQQMLGEELRTRENPTLTKILKMRAIQIIPASNGTTTDLERRALHALFIGQALANWDPKQSIETLLTLWKQLSGLEAKQIQFDNSEVDRLQYTKEELIRTRMRVGDTQAYKDYEPYLIQSRPNKVGYGIQVLLPMADFPQWGEGMAKRLFLSKERKWGIESLARSGNAFQLFSVLDSKLMGLNSVRQAVIAALQDKTVIGHGTRDKNGNLTYRLDCGATGRTNVNLVNRDERSNRLEDKVDIRICDYVASIMTSYPETEKFSLFWKISDRNDAIENALSFIKKYGEHIPEHHRSVRRRSVTN